jgi:xyloglucan:xyloglucosyl transferase
MAAFSSFRKLVLLVALSLTNEASVPVMRVTADQSLQPPLPSISVTSYFKTTTFDEKFTNLWGAGHQNVSKDRKAVTLKIDRYSGGGFKSNQPYMYGLFNVALKLQAGYTAGIVTTFYLSNSQVYPDRHDELDFEFLGTIPGEPYKLHTNIYGNGTGDGNIPSRVGREQQFHLWFDPTQDFHNYSILWTPQHIMFLVDNIPIRQFPKLKSVESQYPSKPMSIYATLWDASDWATDGGKYKANYTYEPFLSTYSNLIVGGCTPDQRDCKPEYLDQLIPPTLSTDQQKTLDFVRKNYMTYDYCQDVSRYPKGLPECPRSSPARHT